MGAALANYQSTTNMITLDIQEDAAEYHSADQPTHEVMKTFTFTAPADCVVQGYCWAGDVKSSAANGAYVDVNANSLDAPVESHSTQNATATYGRRGINCLFSPTAATTELKLYVASAGTLTFQVRGTNGNAGSSVYLQNQRFTVFYTKV
jgi:hypothetical protein